jgi:epoxide hydrolase 4
MELTVTNRILLGSAALAALLALGSCASTPAAVEAKHGKFGAEGKAAHDAVDAAFTQRFLQVGTVRWHYVEAGNPSGPTVLLLHGLPESWYSWSRVRPLLDPSFHDIVPDMKGYGQSSATDTDYNWHTVARQTLELMDARGAGKFFIVGHDGGSLISSVMVSDHPDRFLGYARMEADLKYTPGQSLDELYKQKPQWKLCQDTPRAVSLMADAGPFIDMVYPSRMKTPVLQLQADSDPAQPASSFTDVATLFPTVKLQWITGASHFDNLDQPAQVAAAINAFLGSSR